MQYLKNVIVVELNIIKYINHYKNHNILLSIYNTILFKKKYPIIIYYYFLDLSHNIFEILTLIHDFISSIFKCN